MKYEVYDLDSNKKITQDYNFVLKPNGRIVYNEIGLENIAVLFYPTDNEHLYIDEVGGVHDSGCGYGVDCGECSNLTCSICPVWKKRVKNNWGIITSDKQKAYEILTQLSEELKKNNINILSFYEDKERFEATYENGISIIWIVPTESFIGMRFHHLWCDSNIDRVYLAQIAMPMISMKFEDIEWI